MMVMGDDYTMTQMIMMEDGKDDDVGEKCVQTAK